MGIHGFGQVNNLELQRLLAAKGIQGGQRPATASQQNVDMTRDGSIFNMATPNGVNRRGFNEQNADNSIRPQPKTQNLTQSQEFSVEGGKEAATGAKGQATAAEKATAQTQQHAKQVKALTSESKTLSKTTKKEEKELETKLKNDQRLVEKNNAQLQQLTNNMLAENSAIEALNSELESLVLSSGSMGGISANSSESVLGGGGAVTSSTSDQIATISAQIGARSARMTKYSGKINKLQLSNRTTIRTLNRTSRTYQRTVARNQKTMEAAQSTTDKVMNVANKVAEISQYTTMAGQGVQLIGKGMRALGQAMLGSPVTAAAGAALIAGSVPVEATGVTVETIGNYGSMAASLTNSVCCIANGDYQGAFQNLSAAAATGTAAIQGTQQMAAGFEGIKEQATQAMQQGLEKQAANQLANSNMDSMRAEGFTKKQVKQMAAEQTAGSFEGMSMSEMRADVKAAKYDADGDKIGMFNRSSSENVQIAVENGQQIMTSNLNQVQAAKLDFINNNETIQNTINEARAQAEEAARAAGASAEEIARAGDNAAQVATNNAKELLGTNAGKQTYGKAVNNAAKSAVADARNRVLGRSNQTASAKLASGTKAAKEPKNAKADGTRKAQYAKTAEMLQKTGQSIQSLAAYFPDSNSSFNYGNTSFYGTGSATPNWDTLRYIQHRSRYI